MGLPAKRDPSGVRRLHRNEEEGTMMGVCAGLQDYTGLDAVWWRLAFIITTLLWGAGLPVYFILALAMKSAPRDPDPDPEPETKPDDLSPEDREIWDAVREDMKSLHLRNDQ